jgi:hypothetical protein
VILINIHPFPLVTGRREAGGVLEYQVDRRVGAHYRRCQVLKAFERDDVFIVYWGEHSEISECPAAHI